MATIEQILAYRNLTGVIMAVKSGIPTIAPDSFYRPGRSMSGNKGEYYRITGTRQTAQLVQFGAPSVRRNLRNVEDIPFTMFHTFQNQQWPMNLMIAITKMSELEQDQKGRQQAEYQTREFKREIANLS